MQRLGWTLTLCAASLLAGCAEKKVESATQTATSTQSSMAAPTAAVSGKAIHDAHCISCHDSGKYTRPDRKVQDFAMLAAQVRRCDANLGKPMPDAEVTSVIQYLNDEFYHFPK